LTIDNYSALFDTTDNEVSLDGDSDKYCTCKSIYTFGLYKRGIILFALYM